MRAQDAGDAVGTLAWQLRRKWGLEAWRSAVRLLLDRLQLVGAGATQAHDRRVDASDRALSSRRSAHWLFRRFQG